jgi:peptidoglycan-N-acetylglucosamine deacetylase
MVGTRRRELAALAVATALVATALAPAFVVSSTGLIPVAPVAAPVAGPGAATPEPLDAVVALVPPTSAPNSGIAAGPAVAPDPTAVPEALASPPPKPACDPPPADLTGARVLSHGSRDRKLVALTFDDGYNPSNTLRILGILRQAHVNATFFVTGRAVQLFPGVWREVAAAGYPIGDHTYDHHALKGLCFSAQLLELSHQADAVRDVLGQDPVALMRPPYGSRDATTPLAASAAGDAAVVLWDVDTNDWSGLGATAVARRALSGGKGSIVLMHTLYTTTAAALPRIIAGYRARGFQFVTVGELLGVPGPVPFG